MFRQPIAVGELVTFPASVNHTGTSSMEIGIKVVAEDILKRSVRHANSCFFTMVAVDEEGRPTPVPTLRPVTSDEKRRQAAALIRRQLRQEMEQRHLELLASNPPSPEERACGARPAPTEQVAPCPADTHQPVFCTPAKHRSRTPPARAAARHPRARWPASAAADPPAAR